MMENSLALKDILERELSHNELELPSLSSVALKVSQILQAEEVDLKALSEQIETDAALTAKVLNLANSAFYAGLNKVKTVERAISRVGIGNIRNFLVAASLKDSFKGQHELFRTTFKRNWQHSLGVAICCKRIAEHVNLRSIADDAYLLGLVHDIGVLSILNTLDKHQAELGTKLNLDLLTEITLAFHADLSGQILRKLNFDDKLAELSAVHHTPDSYVNQEDPLFNILMVSDHLLLKTGLGLKPEPTIALLGLPYSARLGLDAMFFAVAEVDIEDIMLNADNLL